MDFKCLVEAKKVVVIENDLNKIQDAKKYFSEMTEVEVEFISPSTLVASALLSGPFKTQVFNNRWFEAWRCHFCKIHGIDTWKEAYL